MKRHSFRDHVPRTRPLLGAEDMHIVPADRESSCQVEYSSFHATLRVRIDQVIDERDPHWLQVPSRINSNALLGTLIDNVVAIKTCPACTTEIHQSSAFSTL